MNEKNKIKIEKKVTNLGMNFYFYINLGYFGHGFIFYLFKHRPKSAIKK